MSSEVSSAGLSAELSATCRMATNDGDHPLQIQEFWTVLEKKLTLICREGIGLEVNRRNAALFGLGCLCFGLPLDAHAILLSSSPAFASIVHGPKVPIQLRFNSRIDQKRSRLTLIDPDGARRTLQVQVGASPDVLASSADDVNKGTHVLQWQVLALDGHVTRGEVRFSVE